MSTQSATGWPPRDVNAEAAGHLAASDDGCHIASTDSRIGINVITVKNPVPSIPFRHHLNSLGESTVDSSDYCKESCTPNSLQASLKFPIGESTVDSSDYYKESCTLNSLQASLKFPRGINC